MNCNHPDPDSCQVMIDLNKTLIERDALRKRANDAEKRLADMTFRCNAHVTANKEYEKALADMEVERNHYHGTLMDIRSHEEFLLKKGIGYDEHVHKLAKRAPAPPQLTNEPT